MDLNIRTIVKRVYHQVEPGVTIVRDILPVAVDVQEIRVQLQAVIQADSLIALEVEVIAEVVAAVMAVIKEMEYISILISNNFFLELK